MLFASFGLAAWCYACVRCALRVRSVCFAQHVFCLCICRGDDGGGRRVAMCLVSRFLHSSNAIRGLLTPGLMRRWSMLAWAASDITSSSAGLGERINWHACRGQGVLEAVCAFVACCWVCSVILLLLQVLHHIVSKSAIACKSLIVPAVTQTPMHAQKNPCLYPVSIGLALAQPFSNVSVARQTDADCTQFVLDGK